MTFVNACWYASENAENIQILRYEHGQKYEPHHDYFHDKVNQARGGHRYATVLMYLSTVDKGGETVFPNAKVPGRRHTILWRFHPVPVHVLSELSSDWSNLMWCRDGSLSARTTLSQSAREKDWQVVFLSRWNISNCRKLKNSLKL